jgi:hypothetical protein
MRFFGLSDGGAVSDEFNATIEYGRMAIRSAFLMNGAAAIAVLGFAGTLLDNGHGGALVMLARSLMAYATGVVATTACVALAYFSQGDYAHKNQPRAERLRWCAIGVFSLAIGLFVAGCWFAREAIVSGIT